MMSDRLCQIKYIIQINFTCFFLSFKCGYQRLQNYTCESHYIFTGQSCSSRLVPKAAWSSEPPWELFQKTDSGPQFSGNSELLDSYEAPESIFGDALQVIQWLRSPQAETRVHILPWAFLYYSDTNTHCISKSPGEIFFFKLAFHLQDLDSILGKEPKLFFQKSSQVILKRSLGQKPQCFSYAFWFPCTGTSLLPQTISSLKASSLSPNLFFLTIVVSQSILCCYKEHLRLSNL